MHIPIWWAHVWSSSDSLQYVGSMWVYLLFMQGYIHLSYYFAKKNKNMLLNVCVCVMNKGDSEDAAVDCGSQHVQELLHHRWHVPPPPVLRICRRCSLWNCQIWREHQPVRIWSCAHHNLPWSSLCCSFPLMTNCRLNAVDAVKHTFVELSDSVCLP